MFLIGSPPKKSRMHTLRADQSCQSSADWLESNGLESAGLSLPHFLSCCAASPGSVSLQHGTGQNSAQCSRTHTTGGQLEVSAEVLRDSEMKLYQMIELYHNRIRWLTEGSRKVFGMVRGSKVAVLVDASDVNCSTDRLIDLQRNLLDLLDKQLRHKSRICPISLGSEVASLWDKPRDTSPLRLREVREWVLQLRPSGGCNLLQALKTAWAQTEELDALLVILGSSPDQPLGLLCDVVEQAFPGREMSVHVVGYCCSNSVAIETVKKLAGVTRGSYHLFSPSLGVLDDSTDLELLWAEIKAARDVLSHIHHMRSGHMEDAEILTGVEEISLSERNSGTDHLNAPLHIQPKGLLPVTSVEWLKTNGLKAQKLGLYHVLAPNAYSPLKEFVPILGKTVTATVHERAMVPFEWHDGTVKNVHVDLPLLFHYQKQLQRAMQELERRLLWLSSTGSRQIWGTVCEPRVQILVDTSSVNDRHWLHILHSLRLLLEEHLANQQSFNVTVFGTEATSWRESLVPVSPKSLQDAWQWLQGRQCAGGRNTLGALRLALEGDHLRASPTPQGLYLFTSGMPDQDVAVVSAYVAERCSTSDVRLHVCLFTAEEGSPVDPLVDTAQALRQLAQAGKGRFHWISHTGTAPSLPCHLGVIESDDVSALIGEMEKATHYWQKCSDLVKSLTQKASIRAPVSGQARAASAPVRSAQAGGRQEKLPPPRPTILTLKRLSNRDNRADKGSPQRAITWRPSSAKAVIPPANLVNGWKPVESNLKGKKVKTTQSFFFLEDGSMGMVFKAYPKPRGVRKGVTSVKLPNREEICSTKQWLKRYGIRSLRLDLHKLVSGPDCVHHKKLVPVIQQKGPAKYCAVLPSVELNGRVRHLQLTPAELRQYLTEAQRLLQRYCHRMQWLLSGSRCVFGAVLESSACFLLDVSGSMAPNLSELKRELASLIWEQLHKRRVRFTLLAFSGDVRPWRPELVEPTDEACGQAEQWLAQLTSHGGTCTLEALQVACGLGAPLGCYLISDGRPDSSCSRLLQEAERLTAGKDITVHTIAFHCRDRADKEFLKTLAHKTGGRFHCAQENAKAIETLAACKRWESKLNEGHELTVPVFEGDDLKRLGEEMSKLMQFQMEARGFRLMLYLLSHALQLLTEILKLRLSGPDVL
ncbi:von Willebrand factor A domain-containing protein 3A [Alosa pseudoharengus]|uniref:von Willebrand factor A domain-containing protein 3A n=1 Tax=Alosa pseudoharengus TaxID=34774 RepID=UPI003F8B7D91